MFSTGQVLFAALFCAIFIAGIAISYKKDKKRHQQNYTGVRWVMLSFVTFVLFLFIIKFLLKT